MREYDAETLRHVQQCELKILKDVARICDGQGLTYFGLAGTGIGAIRHKGFIPWDDDIDIGMPARDLEQLVKIIREEHAGTYDVINADIDSNYPLATTRIMLKGTQFCEETLSELPLDLGIFLTCMPSTMSRMTKTRTESKLGMPGSGHTFAFS